MATDASTKLNGNLNKDNFDMNTIKDNAGRWYEMSKDNGAEMVDRSVEMAKKYPIHTALGAGALGLAAGFVIGKILK